MFRSYIGLKVVFSIIIFASTMAYLLVTNDIAIGIPAFLLGYSSNKGELRFLAILASVAVILGCLYRMMTNDLIVEMADNWLHASLTFWLLMLASLKAYSTIK